MKKVLIINTTLNKGGAARVAYSLFEKLSVDFDMHFAYGRGTESSALKTFYFGNRLEMFIHIFLVRFLGLEGLGSYFSTKKLINYIKRENFALVNLHNLHGYYVNFPQLLNFFKTIKVPIIYSLHDEWPITWLPAHSLGCTHCKTGVGHCTNTYSYPKNYFPVFSKYMLKKKRATFSNDLNMTIVCPSLWLKNNITDSYLNKFKIEVIANGIDTDVFVSVTEKNNLREKYNLPTDKKIVLFSASNLKDKTKGISFILETAKLLEDKNYLFLGLGNGQLENLPNVRTTGYIYNKNKLAEIYALSDIFCFASSAETFLLSAAEALACEIPVVGFDLPVVRELVNLEVGILTETNSIALATNFDELLNNKERLIQMGQNGRELIVQNYSEKLFLEKYSIQYNNSLR